LLSIALAQAAAEYALIAARDGLAAVKQAVMAVVAFVSTPRGILIASAGVVLLAIRIGRKKRY
jgi:hypothetical protein